MRTAKQLIIFLSLCLAIWSCGGEGSSSKSSNGDAQAQSLLSQADEFILSLNQGLLLRNSDESQRTVWKTLLYNSKLALIRLSENSNNTDAIIYLHRTIELMLNERLLESDDASISTYINSLNQVVERLAAAQGLDLTKLQSLLFHTSFANGLTPFSSEASSAVWVMDKAMEASYATVGGYQNKSWLISPLFDLTQVSTLALRIRHTILINRNTGNFAADPFDRAKILKTAFKAKVSTDYTGEKAGTATWEDISLDPLPVSIDFHTITTPMIDLSKYAGKKITIAFLYDMDESLGRHYPMWQINQFDLFGSSTSFAQGPHKNTKIMLNEADLTFIYQHDFAEGLKDFTQVTESGKPFPLLAKTTPKNQKYMEWSNFTGKTAGVNWLISSVFDLKGVQNTALSLNQSINFAPNLDLTKVFAAEVGDLKAAAVTDLKWLPLEFASYPSGNNWTLVKSEWLLLPPSLQGKKIVIGLRHETKTGVFPNWGLYNFDLAATSSAQGAIPYANSIKWQAAANQGSSQSQIKYNTIYKHDFTSSGLEGFTHLTEDGESVAPTFVANNTNNTPPSYVQWTAFGTPPKAGTNWFVSPAIDLSGSKESLITVNHTINKTTVIKNTQLFASPAPEEGAEPSTPLKWLPLKFVKYPDGKSWDSVQSEWLKLPDSLQGKKIVIGFKYISTITPLESLANWRLYQLEIGTPDKISQINQVPTQLPTDTISVFQHDFSAGIEGFNLVTESGSTINPESKTNPNNGEVYIEWSAFAGKLQGVNWLMTPTVKLSSVQDAAIHINHSINFTPDKIDRTKIYAALVTGGSSGDSTLDWIALDFTNYPAGNVWDKVSSEWLQLPDALQGKDIVIGFRYEASDLKYPNWQLYNMEITGKSAGAN